MSSRVLNFRVEADSRSAILEVNAFSDAIGRIGMLAPGQARALRSINDATIANARANKDASVATLNVAKAKAVLATASDREASATLRSAKATDTAAKATTRSATERTRSSRLVMVAFDRETRDIESGAKRQVNAARLAEQEWDRMAKNAQKGFDEVRRGIRATDAEMNRSASRKRIDTGHVITGAQTLGTAMTSGISAPLAGVATYSLKTAIDWETSFTEVKKFVKGSDDQIAGLRKQFRELALDAKVGMSFTEVSHIAAFGGQLGIARENLADFVRQVSYIGQAGDLGGEQAAEGLAKIISVMKLAPDQFRFAGAALAEMGNEGASKLSEILEVAKRIDAAGQMIGLRVPDILAFGNAVISLGDNPEAAGSALTRLFNDMSNAVERISTKDAAKLDKFAKVAGMTSGEFAKAFKEKPMDAILAFETGLGKIQDQGGSVNKALNELDIKGVRYTGTVKKLALGHEELAKQSAHATKAMAEGTAAEDKATIASQTTAREMKALWNEMQDAANTLGESLIPALRDVLKQTKPLRDDIKSLADAFHDMSPEAQSAWTKVALVAAIAGPTIMFLGNIAKAVMDLRAAYVALQGTAAGGAILGGLGTAGGWLRAGGVAVAGGIGLAAPFIAGAYGAEQITKENDKTNSATIKDQELPGFLETGQQRGEIAQQLSTLRERIGKMGKGPYTDSLKKEEAGLQAQYDSLTRVYESQKQAYFGDPSVRKGIADASAKGKGGGKPTPTGKKTPQGGGGNGTPEPTEEEKRKAEAERKKAEQDAAAASKEVASRRLTGLTKSFDATLETLKEKATPAQIPGLKKKLASLSAQMLEAAENVASSELASAKVSDPKNTRAASARSQTEMLNAAIAGGERSKDIGAAVKAAYKRGRDAAHEKATRDRQSEIDAATVDIANLTENMDRAVDGPSKFGLDEDSVEEFRKGMTRMAEEVRKNRKKIADLEYKQSVSSGGDSRSAESKRGRAYLEADSEYEKTTKNDETSLDPGVIGKTIADARTKRLGELADNNEEAAKDFHESMEAMRQYLDGEVRDLQYVRDVVDHEARTLDDVAAKREQTSKIFARRMELASSYLREMTARMMNPSLGDVGESWSKYLSTAQSATLEKKRDDTTNDRTETDVRTTIARNNLMQSAFFDHDKRKSGIDLFTANKGYEAARNGAKTPEERAAIIAGQSQDYANAATGPGSKLDVRDVLQVQETLLVEALKDGNNVLADNIRGTIGTLKEKLKASADDFKRFSGGDFKTDARGALLGGSRNALHAVIDAAGDPQKGKTLGKDIGALGIGTGKDLLKSATDGILGNVENDLAKAGKRAGAELSKEAGKLLQGIGPEIGASIGIAAIGMMMISQKKGKKKTNSIIGGVLGAIAGGILGGGNPTAISGGFSLGAGIGGAFASGGSAPGRKVSLFGENGPELGIPESTMRVLPADVTARLLSGQPLDGAGSIGRGASEKHEHLHIHGSLMHVENVHDRADAEFITHSVTDQLDDRFNAK